MPAALRRDVLTSNRQLSLPQQTCQARLQGFVHDNRPPCPAAQGFCWQQRCPHPLPLYVLKP
jgi:hypothetical protein